MFEKVKEWFLGFVDKVKSFFTKHIKEDVTVNVGGFYFLCLLAGIGTCECTIGIMNLIPKLFIFNAMTTMFVIYLILACLVTCSVFHMLKPRIYRWRAV